MPYKVGVSAGWWKIARDPTLLGLAQKVAGFGATAGAQFIQADLDTTAEFYEPDLKEQMRRAREKMGLEVGLHGEVGELMSLDSAEKRLWEQSHQRLIETVKNSVDMGIKYVNIHLSQRPHLSFTESQQRVFGHQFPVVSFDGQPLTSITNKSRTKECALRHISHTIERSDLAKKKIEELSKKMDAQAENDVQKTLEDYKKNGKEISPAEEKMIRRGIHEDYNEKFKKIVTSDDFKHTIWQEMPTSYYEKFLLEDGEFGAYHIVGTYMKETGDPIWGTLGNGMTAEKLYAENEHNFSAAVSSKYIEGHLTIKNKYNKRLLNGMSIKEWLDKHGLYLLFETPEVSEGTEGLLRLFNPSDALPVIKKLKSEYIKLCIDFEHMLSHKIDVGSEIERMPKDIGKYIKLFHLGKPIPYFGTAHVPLVRGSRSQQIIYEWLYKFRKKGFTDGYIIFERGSGRSGGAKSPAEVMEDSILAIRQIVKYLEQDIAPNDLPAEFFGITWENKGVFARQTVAIRDHAWDPLEGLLMIPEEKHTFLSGRAVERGKAKEWDARKYR